MLAAYKDSKKLNFLFLYHYTNLTTVFPKQLLKWNTIVLNGFVEVISCLQNIKGQKKYIAALKVH